MIQSRSNYQLIQTNLSYTFFFSKYSDSLIPLNDRLIRNPSILRIFTNIHHFFPQLR